MSAARKICAGWAVVLLAGCVAGAGSRGDFLTAELREESPGLVLDGRREVALVYTLHNRSGRAVPLAFATGQHWDLVMKDGQGHVLYTWSEDRAFATESSVVVINPGERLEIRAAVPTRDMARGQIYRVEMAMAGYPETGKALELRPQ